MKCTAVTRNLLGGYHMISATYLWHGETNNFQRWYHYSLPGFFVGTNTNEPKPLIYKRNAQTCVYKMQRRLEF